MTRIMTHRIFALLLAAIALAIPAIAANTRLYLTDGDYHLVKEYEVNGQRVRYLSAERDQWEQIPLTMVDLERTEAEAAEREEALAAELAVQQEEEEALRKTREMVARIPYNFGVYHINGEQLPAIEQAQVIEKNSSTRRILQLISPAPIIPSKLTISVEGTAAIYRIPAGRPEFFFRLAANERFGIVRLKVEEEERVVEVIEENTATEEMWEDLEWIDVFRQQVDDRLYKVWPQADLEPGEYAMVEMTDGERNIQVWPFGVD